MKKPGLFFILLLFISHFAFGQGGTWTWIGGDSTFNSSGVYGTQGVPSINNHPPANYEMVEWKDKQGNFWLYGGTDPAKNDLWKYNPVTSEWTWMKGDSTIAASTIYGVKGIPAASNSPGMREFGAATWVDTSGMLWLFGGYQQFTDLWKYDSGTNEWTWMKGNLSLTGHHGTVGIPDTANNPGARNEAASEWTDALNNLWLFGGRGYGDSTINDDVLNDMMKYSISTNEWTWMKGSANSGAVPVYGTKGVANSTNDPGGRWTYTGWKDSQDNLWIFGGMDRNWNSFSDVWKYDLINNQWTWMNGLNTLNDSGTYVTECVFNNASLPAAREEQRSSVTDNCGRFWLFSGLTFYELNSFNDLWVFDPQLLQWKWLSGSSTVNQPGNYGNIGVPSISNMPPARGGANAWWGNDNKFYLFGGVYNFFSGARCHGDLWVFDPDTTCIPVCISVSSPPPVANFQSSKTTICANDCINFTDLSANATSWQWNFAGGSPSTSTDQNPHVCYLTSGIYNVTLIASNSAGNDTLTTSNYIKVNPEPPTPVITHADTILYFNTDSSYRSYQWYFDSTLIDGATDTLLVATQTGNYNVRVTDKNGCTIAVGINIVGIKEFIQNNYISLSPNPVANQFTIHDARFTIKEVRIYNVMGQEEASPPTPLLKRGESATIDVSKFPAGVYFVRVTDQQQSAVLKFVKE